jgi:peptidoglycan hydrolase CwlO-like protein
MDDFGTIEYWERERKKTANRLQDVDDDISSLMQDAYDLKRQRSEIQADYETILAEIKEIKSNEEKKFHEERMKTDMVYRAMHTPSQKRIVEGYHE